MQFLIGDAGGYYPAEEIIWQVAQTKALLIEQLLESSRYMKTWEFYGFSDEYSQQHPFHENEYFDGEITDREKQVEEEIAIDEEQAWWQQYEFEGYGELKSEKFDLEGVNYEFKAIEEFMFINLRNRRIYIMGNVANFRIYVVGRTKKNDWLGISTKAVWT